EAGPPLCPLDADAACDCVDPSQRLVTGESLFIGQGCKCWMGDQPRPCEFMTATLHGGAIGYPRTFGSAFYADGSDCTPSGYPEIIGAGMDGALVLTLQALQVGVYGCGQGTSIFYTNTDAGKESDMFSANGTPHGGCCVIEITRAGAVGEPIEG